MLGVVVEEDIELLDLRQDVAELIGFEPAHLGDIDDGQPVVGEARNVARAVDDQHRQLRKSDREDADQILDVLGRRVVNQDEDRLAVRLERRDGLDGGHQVGGRLIRERHDGDVGEPRRLDDAALDEPAEVDDEWLAFEVVGPVLDGLPRLQGYDAAFGKCRLVDVGGAIVEVVGEQDSAAVLGVADGVRRLTLPSFDRVEEHGHSA